MNIEAEHGARWFDVCNGDADGLCAVRQWRLHAPLPSILVTGLKREIELLERVQAQPGDELLVCDLSMQRNRAALLRLLGQGARVRYFDHHAAGDIPDHARLETHIDHDPKVCTSLLMDRHLGGAFRAWALVGAYGDNLDEVADAMAVDLGLGATDRGRLRRLGKAINYNAYGEDEADPLVAPARLYALMAKYREPLDLLAHEPIVDQLDAQRSDDLVRARAVPAYRHDDRTRAWLLPDAAWSRRVIGSLANELALAEPALAHAVLKPLRGGGYLASVRAPRAARGNANQLCRRFGGAGRAAAAGIDALPEQELEAFLDAFAGADWITR